MKTNTRVKGLGGGVIGLGILILGLLWYLQQTIPRLPDGYADRVTAAVERAGANRGQLIIALRLVRRDRQWLLCELITRMPRYDLANIRASMLLDQVNGSIETNAQVPWRLDPHSDAFLDSVLPYRISGEGLENSRRELAQWLLPVVRKCKTVPEAAPRVRDWSLQTEPPEWVGSAYPQDYTPMAAWRYGRLTARAGGTGCRAHSLFVVAALRAVGIPASLLERPTNLRTEDPHQSVRYYDAKGKQWHQMELYGDESALTVHQQTWGEVVLYTFPPTTSADYIGQQRYDQLVNVGTFAYGTGILHVTVMRKGRPVPAATVGVYVWRDKPLGWYPAMRAHADRQGHATLTVGHTQGFRPYMVSASTGEESSLCFPAVLPGSTNDLRIDIATPPQTYTVDFPPNKL